MDSSQLRKKFLDYFRKKGHKIVPSSSLVPKDKTVLLTSAGMQQFVPYLSGEKDVLKDFGNRHLCSVQKCFRTPDIDEVGDDTHHTFFEMLGNWSIGEDSKKGYFKEGAIKLALDFFINEIGLDKEKFWITIFKGENNIPRDREAFQLWKKYGISTDRIVEFGIKDNFWGPTAETGPCGPCSEIHYDRGEKYGCGKPNCGPNCEKCNRFLELWNLVFMEYNKDENGFYVKLPQKNIDTGIGFERLVFVLDKKDSAYETDLFSSLVSKIEKLSGKKYQESKKNFRIIADHVRGAVFLAAAGIIPSNIERGYILRRVLRRAIRYGKILKMPENFLILLSQEAIAAYQDAYPEVKSNKENILSVIKDEEERFGKTLEKGLKEFQYKILRKYPNKKGTLGSTHNQKKLSGNDAFYLYQTYGFPPEFMEELCKEKGIKFMEKEFQEAFKKHQEISRAGAEKKFGGLGKKAADKARKLHTATHLLHAALREVLGRHVQQMGSDINEERLRFDFSHSGKMTEEEIKKVEDLVNQKIKEDLEVKREEMLYKEAVKLGALAFFKEKYPQKVSVYLIGNPSSGSEQVPLVNLGPNYWRRFFSKEICAGPHVKRTSSLGRFKIIKEESSSAGVRRIKAILK